MILLRAFFADSRAFKNVSGHSRAFFSVTGINGAFEDSHHHLLEKSVKLKGYLK